MCECYRPASTWPEAAIPELLKLRIEILASADCERYALNLCRWCSKLPALSTEVSVYTVYFRLLHKFNQMDEFTKLVTFPRSVWHHQYKLNLRTILNTS